ncbi:MAG: hypothetical protein ABI207_00650 [Crocinitomicaceae bacterium]
MRKKKIVVLLFCCFLFLSCKKKTVVNTYATFPNGKYTGIFVFDSFPELNFTKYFVGIKTSSSFYNGMHYLFDFMNISSLDSTKLQFKIQIENNHATCNSMEFLGTMNYTISTSENSILGKLIGYNPDYPGAFPDSFTLTYTP